MGKHLLVFIECKCSGGYKSNKSSTLFISVQSRVAYTVLSIYTRQTGTNVGESALTHPPAQRSHSVQCRGAGVW